MSANIWEPGTGPFLVDAESTNLEQVFTATASQTLFTLTEFEYVLASGSLVTYRNGQRLVKDTDWQETSETSFTLLITVDAGDVIVASAVIGSTSANAVAAAASAAAAEAAAISAEASAVAAAEAAVSLDTSSFLTKADNLESLADVATARSNLGLGDAATKTAGTLAGDVLLLAEDAKLPALDGSLLTGLPTPTIPKEIRQVVFYETSAYASGSTAIPQDDTIPQQTEGTQFMSLAITPTAADSILEIEVIANLDNQSGTYGMTGALFRDSTADAINVARTNSYFTSGCQVVMRHREVADSTTARTYKFRAGTPSAIVVAFNGYTSRLMGGKLFSSIKITEYAP